MKIGIIGTGSFGKSSAMATIMSGCTEELVLVDKNAELAQEVAIDMQYGALLSPGINISGGDYPDLQHGMEMSSHYKISFISKKIKIILRMILIMTCYFANESLVAQTAWYFSPSDVNILHSVPADNRISYGTDPLQFGDLRLPKVTGLHPVAIIIHGGCWTSSFADLQNTTALADALRKIGFATWNVEYRREDNQGGGWPGTFNDVANAADFLRTISKQYDLDLNKVIVIGHSAGGHLALWLAGRHQLSKNSPLYSAHPLLVSGVISLGGVPDLKAFRQPGQDACGSDVVGKLLGGKESEIGTRYKDASPFELLPLGVKQFLIYGEEDQVVPVNSSNDYVSKAKKMKEHIELIVVKNAAHHEYNVPNSVTWPELQKAALSLVNMKK